LRQQGLVQHCLNRHPQRRQQLLPGVELAWSAGAPGHQGAMHDLAEAVGAVYGRSSRSPCFWAPVSLRTRADGSTAVFPHFVFDRAKPGTLIVNQHGQRYFNESMSYHLCALAMQPDQAGSATVPSFLLVDARAMRQYGLGMVRPMGMGLRAALADGDVLQGQTLEELARKLGLPSAQLSQTVAEMADFAHRGVDLQFQRGSTLYQRANGDASWTGANPTLGALEQPPFYALRLYPGDIGAATGFKTNEEAGCLDAQGRPIVGLYAIGNDQQSVMGGVYPGPGITLGPGLVFAYLAARSALQRTSAAAPAAH
jgi:hypothetical protein